MSYSTKSQVVSILLYIGSVGNEAMSANDVTKMQYFAVGKNTYLGLELEILYRWSRYK